MKAQIRMIIASVIVIALALTAVSGITYSWFSDTEESKIDISTAVVDFEPSYTTESTSSIGTTLTKGSLVDGVQQFTIDNLAANQQMIIISDIDNKSTVKTVYRMTATYTYASTDSITKYDLQNIAINGTYLTGIDAGDKGSVTITDWTLLNVGADPEPTKIVISTPTTYGDKGTTSGSYLLPDGTDYTAGDWNGQIGRSGLTISIVIEAYQGDYPYEEMTNVTSSKAKEATLPVNKVVKATSIESSGSTSTDPVTNVIVDFSNVTKYDSGSTTDQDVSSKTIQMEVIDIDETAGSVTIDLALKETKGETTIISSPTFDNPVVITMTVPGKITEPKITYNGEEDGTILSSTINSDDTTTVVFSVTHFSEYVIADTLVTTAEGLQASLNAGEYVKLGANITDVSQALVCKVSGTVLDLNGYTISTDAWCLIDVRSNLTILNGTLECTHKQVDDNDSTGRVLNIDGKNGDNSACEGLTLSLKNVNVVGPTSNDYNRGISAYGTKDLTINIDGGTITANHYPLNIAAYNTGLVCNVKGATLTGYCAVQTWSAESTLNFENCILNGVNQWDDETDSYAAIVVVYTASGSTITCKECTISATEEGTAEEYLLDIRTGCTVVLNNCTYSCNDEDVGIEDVKDYTDINEEYVSDVEFDIEGTVLEVTCIGVIKTVVDENDYVEYVEGTVWDTAASDHVIDVYIEFEKKTTCNGKSVLGSTVSVQSYRSVSNAYWPEGSSIAGILIEMPDIVSSGRGYFSKAPTIVAVIHGVASDPGDVAVQYQGDQPDIKTIETEYDPVAQTLTVVFTAGYIEHNVQFDFVTAIAKITSVSNDESMTYFGNAASLADVLNGAIASSYGVSVGDTVEILKDFIYESTSYQAGKYTITNDGSWTLEPVTD